MIETVAKEQDVDNAYPPPNWRPRYNYFDGTQLINSFLGLIVLPYERFSNLRPYALEQMMANDHQNYRWISDLIDNLYTIQIPEDITNIEFIYSTYWHGHDLTPDSNFKVGNFWRHLRNAFAHSGDGTLFFFPISDQEDPDSGTDVTHIGFFDHVEETDSLLGRAF